MHLSKFITPQNRLLYAGALIGVVLLTGFGMLADEVVEGDTLRFDNAILAMFREQGEVANPIGPAWMEEAGRDLTALGSFAVLTILVVAVAIYLLLRRRYRTALFVVFAVVGGTLISTGLKLLFERPRPELTEATRVFTASFPSGHATVSAVVYLTLGVMLAEASTHPKVRTFFVALAIFLTLTIGVSRVYLGVHYPTDVLAGWSLGAAWALLCWVAAKALRLGHNGPESGSATSQRAPD